MTVPMLYACDPLGGLPPYYDYHLQLSFQDISGNDLVKGIDLDEMWNHNAGIVTSEEDATGGAVRPDQFDLGIVFRNPDLYFGKMPSSGIVKVDRLKFQKREDYYYLELRTSSRDTKPPETKITFRMICPHVFGDNIEHDIVTYWKRDSKRKRTQLCHRIELDGKEFSKITYEQHNQISIAVLTVDY